AYNPRLRREERIGRMYRMHASRREPVAAAPAGDIIAVVGLKRTRTGDTLCPRGEPVVLESIDFPEPVISCAVAPRVSRDAERLGAALAALEREDPTFRQRFDPETGETVISGMGELHLEIAVSRIAREHRIEVEVGAPQVAYRRTIEGSCEIEGRLVKQTGGRGQFAVVRMRFEATGGSDVEFEDRTVGGAVPREYVPAVERGIRLRANRRGEPPLVGFRAILVDGRHHEVDSSEIAFEAAAAMALDDALRRMTVTLLEPVVRLQVLAPEECLGALLGDLNARRAQIDDVSHEGPTSVIRGRAPLAELARYTTDLRSMTGGRGTSNLEPAGYAPVPASIAAALASSGGGPRTPGGRNRRAS
ncbi:MAG: elongation factor G, partial [Planctomycetes bacterium]|nr:elongation factor G [Planctomycetota bacterium]